MPFLKIPSDFVLSQEGVSLSCFKTNGFFEKIKNIYLLLCEYRGNALKKSIIMYGILVLLR